MAIPLHCPGRPMPHKHNADPNAGIAGDGMSLPGDRPRRLLGRFKAR
jgi:hypothetical protein